jgi:hypothetical protein
VVELIELRAATVKTDGGAECAATTPCGGLLKLLGLPHRKFQ